MKSILSAGAVAVTMTFGAVGSEAAPLNFQIDVANSSFVVSDELSDLGNGFADWMNAAACNISNCGVTGGLSSYFPPADFTLGEGESERFAFGSINTTGFGAVDVGVVARLAFTTPEGATTDGNADGFAILVGGLVTGGQLSWTNMPNVVTLDDGSVVSVLFEDLSGVDFLSSQSYTVHATVTAESIVSAVPLPAGALLLLAGIGGLAVVRKRKTT